MYLQYLPTLLYHNVLHPYRISSSKMHRFILIVTINSEARLNLVTHELMKHWNINHGLMNSCWAACHLYSEWWSCWPGSFVQSHIASQVVNLGDFWDLLGQHILPENQQSLLNTRSDTWEWLILLGHSSSCSKPPYVFLILAITFFDMCAWTWLAADTVTLGQNKLAMYKY